jgi:hypothetical protein
MSNCGNNAVWPSGAALPEFRQYILGAATIEYAAIRLAKIKADRAATVGLCAS